VQDVKATAAWGGKLERRVYDYPNAGKSADDDGGEPVPQPCSAQEFGLES